MKFEDGTYAFYGHDKDGQDYYTNNGKTIYNNTLTMKSNRY